MSTNLLDETVEFLHKNITNLHKGMWDTLKEMNDEH